jgi:hypothetical protein
LGGREEKSGEKAGRYDEATPAEITALLCGFNLILISDPAQDIHSETALRAACRLAGDAPNDLIWADNSPASVDGSRIARGNSTFWRVGRVQSSVRPVGAAIGDCWP